MTGERRIIIYTDLDGLLLDRRTRSIEESKAALELAKAKGASVVICSSKTRAEIEPIRRALQLKDPFIVENGGAAIIPAGYSPFFTSDRSDQSDPMIVLGKLYKTLLESLRDLQKAFPGKILGFSDMTVEEIARESELSFEQAQLAKMREFDEPFRLINADPSTCRRIFDEIRRLGLNFSQGERYFHLHGGNDKGAAVRILTRFAWRNDSGIFSIGLGDSINDLSMLSTVDYPILIRRPDGTHQPEIIDCLPTIHLTRGVGQIGWSEAVLELLDRI